MKKEETFILTPEGYLELEEELNTLKTVRRPEIIKALKEARALGDLSENADYDAARNDQAQIEAKIKELEYKLEHSEIADKNNSNGKISIGSTVLVKYDDGEEDEYVIVGSVEADPFNNKVSDASPIGKAIIGHKANEKVDVESPNGSYQVEILKVS